LIIEDLRNAVDHLSIYEPEKGVLKGELLSAGNFFVISTRELGIPELTFRLRGANQFPSVFLCSNIALLKEMSAINVEPTFEHPNLILDVFSVKENGCEIFEKFIKSIPIVGGEVRITERRKKYSSPYCCEPYPAAAMLWTCSIARKTVPNDILNYFNSSIVYFEKNEWRISIILAAIVVESLLAEMYEEYFHEVAPSDPLGALRDKIETRQKFPTKVRKDIESVNQSRISAVHRGSMPVGEREARNALMGATKFTHWAFSEGPLSR
jgi:hypothetical protein